MIELIDVKKDYVASKTITQALRGVSFQLPDKGMVFITGKSGSGKSTLLNILGGLDDKTNGQVIVDGVDITKVNNNELDEYRNKYVGIIYQNFNLFPNETVFENIQVAASICEEDIPLEEYDTILQKVDLLDKKDSLVKNLSGGQRQRVAIARSLIKKPELILADEPTGNLDSKTATSIFNLLKEISEEKLVVIISHDRQSAEKYADRIITLKDGLVESDKIRNLKTNKNEKIIEIKSNQEISDEELKKLNKTLGNQAQLVTGDRRFSNFKDKLKCTRGKPDFGKGKVRYRASFILSKRFFKGGIASFILTLLISTILFTILSFSHSFMKFDGSESLDTIIQNNNVHNFVIKKGYSEYDNPNKIETKNIIRIQDEDIKEFRDNGYDKKIYYVYNQPLEINKNYANECFNQLSDSAYAKFYSTSGIGTVVCDEDYLHTMFGDYEVLAGSIEKTKTNMSLIATDYFMDSFIALNGSKFVSDDPNDPYQKVVGRWLNSRYEIGAVINTGYKERFKDMYELFMKAGTNKSSALVKMLVNSEDYAKWMDELKSALNYCYTINPNFVENFPSYYRFVPTESALASTSEGNRIEIKSGSYFYPNGAVEDNTIVLNKTWYEKFFGNEKSFADRTDDIYVTFDLFQKDDDKTKDKPLETIKLKVVGVSNVRGVNAIGDVSINDKNKLVKHSVVPFSLIMTDMDKIYDMSRIAQNRYYYTDMSAFSSLFQIFDTITLFNKFFIYLVIVLLFVLLLVITSYNLRVVKKSQYRIGVYRGLGYSNKTIVLASLINLAILTFSLLLATFVFTLVFDKLMNLLLVTSFYDRMKVSSVLNYVLIKFSLPALLFYNGLLFVISGISIVAPLLYIRKLKPNKILNRVAEWKDAMY